MRRFLILLVGFLLGISTIHAQNPGDLDLTFNVDSFNDRVGANSIVYTSALQPDGKILIGGEFTSINGTSINRIARLNVDGSLDASFDPGTGANTVVIAITIQPDGKILIGGYFTHINGTAMQGIARLNADGSLDTSFNPGAGAESTVWSIVVQPDGKILIGGGFISIYGESRNNIARLNADGSLDTSFNTGSGASNTVLTIALQPDGKIFIGGYFTSFNGIARNRIGRLNSDGSLDTSFNPGTGANYVVDNAVLQPNGKILIVGSFTSYNGIWRSNIARINADGSLDDFFNPGTGANDIVKTIAVQPDGNILIGGRFSSFNGSSRNHITRLNVDGSLDSSFNPGTGADSNIWTIAIQSDGKILIGGNFTSYNGKPSNYIARINADGSIGSMGANSWVRTLALQPDGKVLIGGEFTSYNGTSINKIARLNADGSLDTSFNPGTGANKTVWTTAVQPDGKILIGGQFSSYNGTSRNGIARLNADGSLDTSFNPGIGVMFDRTVFAIVHQPDGKILMGGDFYAYNDTAANGIARLNADGSLDPSFDRLLLSMNDNVFTIALKPDGGIFLGGNIFPYWIIRGIILLNSDGSQGSFSPDLGNGSVTYITALQPDGKLLVGGNFYPIYDGKAINRITRLNVNGSKDLTFNLGPEQIGLVYNIALQPDGRILIGGEFTSINGTTRNRVARLNADGSLDTSFIPGTGADNTVWTTALQPDGKILIGGNFTEYYGVSRGRIARIYGDFVSEEDTEKPVPSAEVLPDLNFQCGVSYDMLTIPTATDNVDGTIQGTTDQSIFPIALQGSNTIIWTYTDEAGNTSSQTQTFIVEDTIAPVPNLAQLPVISEQSSVTLSAPTANDTCAGMITGTTSEPTTYTEPGTYMIIWSYDDGNGNTATQNQTVIVTDIPMAKDVKITGIAKVEEKLTGSYTYLDVDGDPELGTTLGWFQSATGQEGSWTEITGASGAEFTLTLSELNQYIRFGVRPNDGKGFGVWSYSEEIGPVESVGPIALTITAPTLKLRKDYDGTNTALVTAGMLSGILVGDSVSVTATASYQDANAGTGKTIVVTYMLSGKDSDNYVAPEDYQVTTGEILKAPLKVIAEDKEKVFGALDQSLTVSYSGFVNGESETSLGGTLAIDRETGESVRTYAVIAIGYRSDNYAITYEPGTFTIKAKSLTGSDITVAEINSLVYTGQSQTPEPLVNDRQFTLIKDTDYILAYQDNLYAGTALLTLTGIGNYSGTTNQNFTISKAQVTITADDKTKVYGKVNPTMNFFYTGLVNGDLKVAVEPSISTTATSSSNAGTYPINLTGGTDQNYTITLVGGELLITPATLRILSDSKSKIYGKADPILSYQVSGLKGTDTEAEVLSGILSREAGEEPGIYSVVQGSLKANGNYLIAFTGGNLEIIPARVLTAEELEIIQTSWGKDPLLPSTVQVLTTDGQYFQVGVTWHTSGLNVFSRGTYIISGTFILPNGVENPDELTIPVVISVLPKPAPRDVGLSKNSFDGSMDIFFIPIGAFMVEDPIDQIHTVTFLGDGYDNRYFEIKDNILFWSSAERAEGKTTFTIVTRVTDRDGNTLDKLLEITRTRLDINEIQIENTFTPNNDGFNDTWGIPEIRFYQGARVQVFERSGERVFYTEDPDVRWDGTFKGKELAVGTYYWVLEIRETGEIRRGILNLLRN